MAAMPNTPAWRTIWRKVESKSLWSLRNLTDQSRTDEIGDGQRQPLPGADEQLQPGIRSSMVRRSRSVGGVFPMQRNIGGSPLLLELMRASTGAGAAEVEHPEVMVHGVLEHRPVHQHVGAEGAVLAKRRCPRHHDRVAPAEGNGAGNGHSPMTRHEDMGIEA